MAHPPGEVFYCNNGNPDLVSAIIAKLTGRLSEDFARQGLFDPLGIDDWHWDRDPQFLTIGEVTFAIKLVKLQICRNSSNARSEMRIARNAILLAVGA
jgi:hypothetical protein